MKTRRMEISELTKRIDPVVWMESNWGLVTAKAEGKVNAMTVAWGAFGNVWWKKTVILYIRPQRCTKELMDREGHFTLTFFAGHKKEMTYLGSNSGRDVPDKIERAGLHTAELEGQPTFEEGRYVLILKTLYRQPMEQQCFADPALGMENYPDKDYSEIYIAEIEAAYEIEK